MTTHPLKPIAPPARSPVPASRSDRPTSLASAARSVLAPAGPAHRPSVAICDVSASMSDCDVPGSKRRIDALNEILRMLQAENPTLRLIAFSDVPRYAAIPLPAPGGSTALHLALDFSRSLAVPGVAVALISDGEPDDEQAALSAARRFPVAVNVFYCGPVNGSGADFLKRLAALTGGQYQPVTLAPAQALPALRRVLALPSAN